MAKLTGEQAAAELKKYEDAIAGLTAANIPIPQPLQDAFDKLKKQLTGSASAQLAKVLNDTICVSLNDSSKPKNVELKNSIIEAMGGDKVKLTVVATKSKNEAGQEVVTLSFEAASSGGGTSSTGNAGVTRSEKKFNNWVVKITNQPVDKDGKAIAYPAQESTTASANGALKFILNNGNNPLNLGAEFGTGNAATRVLLGVNLDGSGGLANNAEFKKYFTIEASHVAEPVKPTATETTEGEGETTEQAEQ